VTVPDSVAEEIGTGPGRWPVFVDTVQGLLKLKKHYKLIILSNVSNTNIRRAVRENMKPVAFDAVYTAESIGSYKPSHRNFEYLFQHAKEELGVDVEKGELLHVARSLTVDHVPAKELGFRSVWISRGGDQEEGYGTGGNYRELVEQGKVAFEWKFDTIGQFASEVERQFGH
jgi:2-haloalkanoic acid dehalogenase type II